MEYQNVRASVNFPPLIIGPGMLPGLSNRPILFVSSRGSPCRMQMTRRRTNTFESNQGQQAKLTIRRPDTFPHKSRTSSVQDVDRSNATTFVRRENKMLINPLRKWVPTATNLPLIPPRAGTRNLPPAPQQVQPVYDSPRPHRAKIVTRPRSASLQCLPGQYLDMRAARSRYLYEPISSVERSTIV